MNAAVEEIITSASSGLQWALTSLQMCVRRSQKASNHQHLSKRKPSQPEGHRISNQTLNAHSSQPLASNGKRQNCLQNSTLRRFSTRRNTTKNINIARNRSSRTNGDLTRSSQALVKDGHKVTSKLSISSRHSQTKRKPSVKSNPCRQPKRNLKRSISNANISNDASTTEWSSVKANPEKLKGNKSKELQQQTSQSTSNLQDTSAQSKCNESNVNVISHGWNANVSNHHELQNPFLSPSSLPPKQISLPCLQQPLCDNQALSSDLRFPRQLKQLKLKSQDEGVTFQNENTKLGQREDISRKCCQIFPQAVVGSNVPPLFSSVGMNRNVVVGATRTPRVRIPEEMAEHSYQNYSNQEFVSQKKISSQIPFLFQRAVAKNSVPDLPNGSNTNRKASESRNTSSKPCTLLGANVQSKSYAFPWMGYLKKHLSSSSGQDFYKCDECDYVTSDFGSLISHQRIHSWVFQSHDCNRKKE